MSLFLLVFFTVYSSVHLYAFLKARAAFAFSTTAGIGIGLFMALMIAAPIIVRLSETAGYDFFARLLSYIGYTWMGMLFLFFSFSLALDLYRLLVYSGGMMLKTDLSNLMVSSLKAFYLPLFLAGTIAAYGYFEAKNIRTERLTIKTTKLPKEVEKITVVQISDVHLGLIVRGERLRKILAHVKAAEPDIFVSTGDLVDGQINNLTGLAELLREINPRYGKFAITGNHEFYAGLEEAIAFTRRAGFQILRGEGVSIPGLMNIAGVDDPVARNFGISSGIPEEELLSRLDRERFTLLLKHRPLIDKRSSGLFDLQLSGHVHKGQIFPFSIITWLYYPVDAGLVHLANNSSLYVSRGTGTWGPPIRFLSPPEVTVIELVRSAGP